MSATALAQTSSPAPAATPANGKHVLLLFPGPGGRPQISAMVQGAERQLTLKYGPQLSVEAATIDAQAERDPRLEAIQQEWFQTKYASDHFDVVIALGASVLPTATEVRNEMWPDASVVFCCLDRAFLASHPSARTTGIFAEPDWEGNVRLARQLFPDTRHIALVGGNLKYDHILNDPAIAIVRKQKPALDLIDLSNLSLPAKLARARELPPHTVILSGSTYEDAAGNKGSVLAGGFRVTLAREANAPVLFGIGSSFAAGGLGGYMANVAELGKETGDLTSSILTGTTSPDAPPAMTHAIHLRLNWNEIQRWRIPARRIPTDAVIEFAPPSLWETHKDAVVLAILALAAQSLLIFFLMMERRKRQTSQRQLAERLRFEMLLAQVSSEFAHIANGGMEPAIENCLRAIQSFFGLRTASTWEPLEDGKSFLRTRAWPREVAAARPSDISAKDYQATLQHLLRGESVLFSNEAERDAREDGASYRTANIRSYLAIPLQDNERVIGFIGLTNLTTETAWPPDIVPRLRVIANILGGVLARRHAADALRESELLKLSILESIQGSVAVIDHAGIVLEVNQQWLDSSARGSAPLQTAISVGADYLEMCGNMSNGRDVAAGIRSVLRGGRQIFEIEHENLLPSEQQWFRMTVMRLSRPQGGAVVSHLDITQQKLAALEEQRMQEDLMQMNRAAEMGQMAASLAHELAQPLAAVLSNAQAALRLAARDEPDIAEVRAALGDIIEDDQRARAVLNNVRSILKKHAVTLHRINLNEIVDSVTLIAKSNAQIRGIQMRILLSPNAVEVQGDEVPLQQVLLNLINNAMDAMSHLPPERRVLTLKTTTLAEKASGLLTVEDEGPGIPDALRDKLFSPFFTTKSDGLGMGLAICRAILQSLGGSIRCQNRPGDGAAFHVELPLAIVASAQASSELLDTSETHLG